MTLPAGFPYPLNQVVEIPLEHILPNPDQPRKLVDQEAIQLLAASIKAKGQEVPARARPLTDQERVTYPNAWIMLIGGHGRREAVLLNQSKTLKCLVEDIPPEKTKSTAARDNTGRPLHWWEWYLIFEEENKITTKTKKDIADEYGQYETKVYNALKVTKTLNEASRALVLENLQKSLIFKSRNPRLKYKGFLINETHLLRLADLEDPNRVLEALQMVLDDYLTTDQTQKLVDWVLAGNPAVTFNPNATPNTPEKAIPAETSSSHVAEVLKAPAHTHKVKNGPDQTTSGNESAADNHTKGASAKAAQISEGAASSHIRTGATKPLASAGHLSEGEQVTGSSYKSMEPVQANRAPRLGASEQLLWEAATGISIISQIKAKIKKGEKPNWGEGLLVGVYDAWHGLVKLIKHGKQILKVLLFPITFVGRITKEGLEAIGLYKKVKAVFFLALLIFVLLFARNFLYHAGVWAFHAGLKLWKYSESFGADSPKKEESTSAPQPATPVVSQPVTAVVPLIPPKKIVSAPRSKPASAPGVVQNISGVVAWQPEEETQTNLESEYAAIPKDSVIQNLSFPLGSTLDGALAERRLQDITDPDKYALMIGHDKQKVTRVLADTTGLNITYQNGLIGLVTGGSLNLNFYWEDVRAIHCYQIQPANNPKGKPLYQCSLVLADTKQPFVVQSTSASSFGRLVSALQFWIQVSGNKGITVTGLPYMNHGLLMNNDRVVTQVWAQSPADLAGVKVGDHLWSAGSDLGTQEDRAKLIEALQTPGPLKLYVVTALEWTRATNDMATSATHGFYPLREKRSLPSL